MKHFSVNRSGRARLLLCTVAITNALSPAHMESAMVDVLTPPVAPQKEHREVRHGETVLDPYFWLREKSNPEVVRYLEAENAYTEAMTRHLKPFEDALYREILARI